MKVYTGAKILGISSRELINRIDKDEVDHHMDNIPEELLPDLGLYALEEETKTVDTSETKVMEAKPAVKLELPKGVTPEQVWHACTGIGSKHKLWKYRDLGKKPTGK